MSFLKRITFTLIPVLLTCVIAVDRVSAAGDRKDTADVLLVTGRDHPAHDWRRTAPALASVLRKDTRLQVRTVEDPYLLDSAAIGRYDVIVIHFMNWQEPPPGRSSRENLQKFVAGGKGLVIIHFGCGAFRDWPEYTRIAGRVWDPNARAHDPRGPFRVDIKNADHPITTGMAPFETVDELYTCLTGETAVKVLATAQSKVDGKEYPMAFVLNYGRGRVFHCALGHDTPAIENKNAAELFRRGCAWAAGLNPVANIGGENSRRDIDSTNKTQLYP